MSEKYRLILSSKNNANTNMQIDKALLKSFEKNDIPIFRLYEWTPSFSIGASQKCEDFSLLLTKYKNDFAKRITGGGVLFHGFDISYTLVMPSFKFESLSVKQSYEKICQFLLNFYKNLGLSPNFAKDLHVSLSKSDFCQVGYEAYDIIINGKKIGGNAQKRVKNVIFQHGSIPIYDTFDKINEGFSLKDLHVSIDANRAKQMLINSFKESFDVEFIPSNLNEKEENMLKRLLEENQ